MDPVQLEDNLYAYARQNPVNFVDPSGYVSQAEAGLAEKLRHQLLLTYGIIVFQDYGMEPTSNSQWVPPHIAIVNGQEIPVCSTFTNSVWNPGLWTLPEFSRLTKAVGDLAF
jgi:hypothetical protein